MIAHQLDGAFSALADPTRRRVIELLRTRPRRAGELAAALHMSPPAMSRHLRVLLARKLILDERVDGDARVRQFRLRREPFQDLRAWLDQVESFWTDQLGAFHAHVERKRKVKRP